MQNVANIIKTFRVTKQHVQLIKKAGLPISETCRAALVTAATKKLGRKEVAKILIAA